MQYHVSQPSLAYAFSYGNQLNPIKPIPYALPSLSPLAWAILSPDQPHLPNPQLSHISHQCRLTSKNMNQIANMSSPLIHHRLPQSKAFNPS